MRMKEEAHGRTVPMRGRSWWVIGGRTISLRHVSQITPCLGAYLEDFGDNGFRHKLHVRYAISD